MRLNINVLRQLKKDIERMMGDSEEAECGYLDLKQAIDELLEIRENEIKNGSTGV